MSSLAISAVAPDAAPPIPHPDRELLRVVVVGSVDDGKSSLIGRLLYECDGLFDDQIASVRSRSPDGEIDFSLFTDGLKAEREQGITIDVAYRYLTTPTRQLILADTPGHVQYTRNMATGASTADAVVVLVDARLGVQAQTRRHAFIAALLGIPHLAVAVNKIDLVADARTVYERLAAEVAAIAAELGFARVRAFPVSAKRGDNITVTSTHTPWHSGGTLLQWLEALPHAERRSNAPMRLPVQLVLRPDLEYRGFAGSLAAGTLRVGDDIEVFPSRVRTRVRAIDTFDGPVAVASAPAAITVRLEHEVDIARGDVIAHIGTGPQVLDELDADLVWFGESPLVVGGRYLVKQLTRCVTVVVELLAFQIELERLTRVAATQLAKNDLGRVRLRALRPLVGDPYAVDRMTGALILIDPLTNATVGAGMIVATQPQPQPQPQVAPPPLPLPSPLPLPIPFPADRAALLDRLVTGLDPASLHWLSGYAAGLAAGRTGVAPAPASTAPPSPALVPSPLAAVSAATILYGSHTGNGRAIAEQLHAELAATGVATRLRSTAGYTLRDLSAERRLYLVLSTHGDGDPPDDARVFYDQLLGRRAPKLPELRYAVLALGDSSYPKFCAVGRIVDERLATLGATPLQPRIDCDVEFAIPTRAWRDRVVADLRREPGPSGALAAVVQLAASPPTPSAIAATRIAPATLVVAANQRITGRGATKDVRHVELTFDASTGALAYEPGDALAIVHSNPPDIVAALLTALNARGDEPIAHAGIERPLATWLTDHREITRTTRPVLVAHAAATGIAADADLDVTTHQVVDLLRRAPGAWTATALVAALRPLAPRSYSIASSPRATPDEIHLTVAVVDYLAHGHRHRGSASAFLADRDAAAGDPVRGFVESNRGFRLPTDDAADLLMIGPGTGVAPFRAFVQDRAIRGARGRNWLVFGDHHRRSQFLYQTEWLDALKAGTLHALDVAFSRDQTHKLYVQHRLLARGREVFAWLAGGAHVYVCGDARAMAPDVEAALLAIAQRHGDLDADGAADWLADLRAAGRYQRDVY